MNVVKFAQEVLYMQETIDWQKSELARLYDVEKKYHELLDDSVKHGEIMMGNVLGLLLTDGVMDACKKAHNETQRSS